MWEVKGTAGAQRIERRFADMEYAALEHFTVIADRVRKVGGKVEMIKCVNGGRFVMRKVEN